MPRPSRNAVPVTAVPIRPCSISGRATRPAPRRKVWGAEPRARPRAAAVTTSVRPASAWTASGFSVNTCFPAERAFIEMSKCATGIVRLSTRSTVGSAMSAPTSIARMPKSAARRAAASGVYIGAGDDLDAAEQRGIAQVGHRDVAAADNADPQARFTGLRHDLELTLGLRERKRRPCPRRVGARDPATLALQLCFGAISGLL